MSAVPYVEVTELLGHHQTLDMVRRDPLDLEVDLVLEGGVAHPS